jgi:hypothetical protein
MHMSGLSQGQAKVGGKPLMTSQLLKTGRASRHVALYPSGATPAKLIFHVGGKQM